MEPVTSGRTTPNTRRKAYKKSLSNYGKGRCWKCGERDIWKRRCGNCSAKFCAQCLLPGPVLTHCCLCETILQRQEALQSSRGSILTRLTTFSLRGKDSTRNKASVPGLRRVYDDEMSSARSTCSGRLQTTPSQ